MEHLSIGDRIKRIRKEKNLSQHDLAVISGVAQQTISNAETGRNDPNSESLRLLADALGVSKSELLGEDVLLSDHKLTPREFKMISEFRKLNPVGQKQLIELATFYQTKEEYKRR